MKKEKPMVWGTIFKERFLKAEVTSSSVIIAYYLLLSLFPLMIAVGNILPYLNIAPNVVLPYINTIVPADVQPVLNPVITSLLTQTNSSLLSISALGLVWSASRGIVHLQRGMNRAYGVKIKGSFVIKHIISMLMVLAVLLLLIAFILLFSIGQVLLTTLGETFGWAASVNGYLKDFKWPVTIVFLLCILLLAYRIIPDVKLRLRDIWPGTVLSTVGLMLLTQMFTLYVRATSRSFNSYGALGAFFVLMFWLNFSCILILTGTVLNASIYEIRYGKATTQTSRIDKILLDAVKAMVAKIRTFKFFEKKSKKNAKNTDGKKD